ncbi:MAG: tripartite tricarboxylate transporter permease [Phyllobacterium sp.]
MPGVGPLTAIAILLPVTFHMSPTASLIMLAGIYYGANHAGSTTAIMLNMPGEPAAVVICLDGHPLAKQGRAGPALCMAALSSFFAGCVCIFIIMLLSPPAAKAALQFQAPEYVATIILALIGISAMSSHSMISTFAMATIGILIGTVGIDINSGIERFTLGDPRLSEGIHMLPMAMGLFALVEIATTLSEPEIRGAIKTRARDLIPTWADIKTCAMPTIRGTGLGAVLGVIPGTGPLISSFFAYAVEKKIAKDPSRFGKGAIEGVAAPEAAANAAAFTHFIPMLALGIPAGASMALLLGAMLIQGVQPGPTMMVRHPEIFWGLIASMWIGNLMLLVLNLPLVGVWIKMLQTPYRFIYPAIIIFCCIGVYADRNQSFDILLMVAATVFGFVMTKLRCSPAPLLLGLILGPILEENFRRSLLLSRGDWGIFVSRPISLTILLIAVVLITLHIIPLITKRRGIRQTAIEAAED